MQILNVTTKRALMKNKNVIVVIQQVFIFIFYWFHLCLIQSSTHDDKNTENKTSSFNTFSVTVHQQIKTMKFLRFVFILGRFVSSAGLLYQSSCLQRSLRSFEDSTFSLRNKSSQDFGTSHLPGEWKNHSFLIYLTFSLS